MDIQFSVVFVRTNDVSPEKNGQKIHQEYCQKLFGFEVLKDAFELNFLNFFTNEYLLFFIKFVLSLVWLFLNEDYNDK